MTTTPKNVKRPLKFSLRSIFALTTLAAFIVYFMPITYTTTCDFQGRAFSSNSPTKVNVDIQGRNKNQPFEDVILNVPLSSVERTNDPRLGRWKIEFRTNLYHYVQLRNYEILRFRNSEP